MWTGPLIKDNKSVKQGDNASCHQSPSLSVPFIVPSVSSGEVSLISAGQKHAGVNGQEATSSGNTSLHFQLGGVGGAHPSLSSVVLLCTLPETEPAALEEQVAAGHRANLTGLFKPGGTSTKKTENKSYSTETSKAGGKTVIQHKQYPTHYELLIESYLWSVHICNSCFLNPRTKHKLEANNLPLNYVWHVCSIGTESSTPLHSICSYCHSERDINV